MGRPAVTVRRRRPDARARTRARLGSGARPRPWIGLLALHVGRMGGGCSRGSDMCRSRKMRWPLPGGARVFEAALARAGFGTSSQVSLVVDMTTRVANLSLHLSRATARRAPVPVRTSTAVQPFASFPAPREPFRPAGRARSGVRGAESHARIGHHFALPIANRVARAAPPMQRGGTHPPRGAPSHLGERIHGCTSE
jgi:hypothetical protein